MNLKNLEYFIAVCDNNSFTKAADLLFLSQSALSKSIKNLEEELDHILIDRTSRKFKLTDKGEILYEMGRKLLDDIAKDVDKINDTLSGSIGKLVIGIAPVISTVYFTSVVHQFKRDYPDIELVVIEAGAYSLTKLLEDGRVDIAMLINPIHNENFKCEIVARDEAVLLVNKEHPLSIKTKVVFEDLKDENFILLDDTYLLYHQIVKRANDAGFTPNIIGTSHLWDYVCESVSNNYGISILPRPILYRFHLDNIRVIPFGGNGYPWEIVMCANMKKNFSHVMKEFWNYVPKNINQQ